jgi:hypothetical protein
VARRRQDLISGGHPGYLFSERSDYGDFHLRAEARINSGGNSGILIRTTQGPGIGRPGYEAQICADVAGQIKTGSIGKLPPWQPVAVIDPSPAPANTWFDLEIIARGPKIQVKVNGATTAEYSDPENAHRSGRIGLQRHDDRSRVEFRKIEIREAEPPRTVAEPAPSLLPRAVLEGHTKWVESFAFSPDGQTVVTNSGDHPVRMWNVATGDQTGKFRADDHNIASSANSPDGTLSHRLLLRKSGLERHPRAAGRAKHDDWVWAVASAAIPS